jgi:hypothetical protein
VYIGLNRIASVGFSRIRLGSYSILHARKPRGKKQNGNFFLGWGIPNAGRKPASIQDSHKGGGPRSGPIIWTEPFAVWPETSVWYPSVPKSLRGSKIYASRYIYICIHIYIYIFIHILLNTQFKIFMGYDFRMILTRIDHM